MDILTKIVSYIADKFDPTPNNKYLDWIVRIYTRNAIGGPYYGADFSLEDDELVNDVLRTFHENKKHLNKKDINQYKTFTELKEAVNPFMAEMGEEKKQEMIATGKADVLFEAGGERLIHIKTLEASKVFGAGTEWCTQYPNMFRQYAEQGPIYIIDTPNPDERVQIHFESGQIMDVNDTHINPNELEDSAAYRWLLGQKKKEIEQLQPTITRLRRAYRFFEVVGGNFDWVLGMIKTINNSDDLYVAENILIDALNHDSLTDNQYEKGKRIIADLEITLSQ